MNPNSYELGFVVACLGALAAVYLTVKALIYGIWWVVQ
jgi:hypothetical protein